MEGNSNAGWKVRLCDSGEELTVQSFQVKACLADCVVWDLPGGGTTTFPSAAYTKQFGLRYFDMIVLMSNSRFREEEVFVAREARQFDVPYFLVRTKIDDSVIASVREDDIDEDDAEAVQQVREKVCAEIRDHFREQHGEDSIYLVSSLPKFREQYDFAKLEAAMAQALMAAREGTSLPEDGSSGAASSAFASALEGYPA